MAKTTTPTRTKPDWAVAFKKRREEVVGSQEEMAIRADVSQSLISQIERGVQVPTGISVERFGKLLSALNWTAHEFVQATGLDISLDQLAAPTSNGAPVGLRHRDEVVPVYDLHRIPVRGMAAAGPAFYGDDNILGYEYVEDENFRSGMLSVQIDGDSMEPTIPHGSRVYIDSRELAPQDGKMYLIHITGDGLVVKRAKKVSGSWFLMSDNPKYQAFTPDEATIIGEVYYVQPRGWKPS